eukprot:COSAG06_NODE_38617_length_421_cov_1.444099_1_plen_22_part_10
MDLVGVPLWQMASQRPELLALK